MTFEICGRCRKRASGNSASHCNTCHHTFSSPSGFERHRVGGQCRKPEDIGLRLVTRGTEGDEWECWEREPMSDEAREARFGGGS